MRNIITFLGLFVAAATAQAQVGPTPARAIIRPMPSKAPSVQTFNAEADLIVSKKGRVDFVEIVSSSGDPAFDKEWKKSLEDWRYVPAVDAAGEPAESHSRVTYKNNALSESPWAPDGAAATPTLGEPERLARMTCNDFLWEYYIVSNALPRRLALLDSLLKTPLAMYTAEANPTQAQQTELRSRYDDLVDDAAKQCRDNPGTAFWSGIFKPMLQAAVAQ